MKHTHTTAWAFGMLSMTLACVAESLPDPTRPVEFTSSASIAPAAEAPLRVEAIMRSGARHLAIVNGKLVRPGDRVNGAVVREIDADGLHYVIDGRERTAKLPASAVKVRRTRTEVLP